MKYGIARAKKEPRNEATQSSKLTFDRIMLVPRTPHGEYHSYYLLQACTVASRAAHRSSGAASSTLKVSATRLPAPLYYSRGANRFSKIAHALDPGKRSGSRGYFCTTSRMCPAPPLLCARGVFRQRGNSLSTLLNALSHVSESSQVLSPVLFWQSLFYLLAYMWPPCSYKACYSISRASVKYTTSTFTKWGPIKPLLTRRVPAKYISHSTVVLCI